MGFIGFRGVGFRVMVPPLLEQQSLSHNVPSSEQIATLEMFRVVQADKKPKP